MQILAAAVAIDCTDDPCDQVGSLYQVTYTCDLNKSCSVGTQGHCLSFHERSYTDSVNQDNCFIHIMHYDNLDVAYHIAYYTLRQN